MKPEIQRAEIAKACGWKFTPNFETDVPEWEATSCWTAPDKDSWSHQPLPDYLNDLNAMHEAEKLLTHDQCTAYHQMLDTVQAFDTEERDGEVEYPAQDFWFHATADQRAEAFLRTMGKWV